MESAKETEEQAAVWLLRREAPGWSESDQEALTEWLESSTANTVAFVRLEVAWKETHRLKALSAGTKRGLVPSPDDWQLSPFYEQRHTKSPTAEGSDKRIARWRWHGFAASVAVTVVGAVSWHYWPAGTTYQTPVGGSESVPLPDGSKVTLNTDTEIRVAVTRTERGVQLERGEAYFEVAKDPGRPFVVRAADKRVIAVGTKFSVEKDGDKVRVVVSEGIVRVDDNAPSTLVISNGSNGSNGREGVAGTLSPRGEHRTHSSTDLSGQGVTLPAGSVAHVEGDSVLVQDKPLQEVNEEYLSWRGGYLIFRDIALADAVAEFNRYNTRKMIIKDSAIAAIKLSGKFRSTNFEAFVRLLEDGFAIHAQATADEIILTHS